MTKEEFFLKLVREILSVESPDDEVLACMILLHTHCIEVARSITIDDAGSDGVLSPLTRRHCAAVVATALAGTLFPCADESYWYSQYDQTTPYEVATDVKGEWIGKVNRLMISMKATGLVSEFKED
jgi:hypothetical protein